jgi:hypothetical protein
MTRKNLHIFGNDGAICGKNGYGHGIITEIPYPLIIGSFSFTCREKYNTQGKNK